MRAAMPLYEKHHSWGEFVFDWAWAQAYERAGIPYYPKLVSAVPFTPAQSSRLLLRDPADADAAQALLAAALQLAADTDCSSLHVQFPMPGEFAACEEAGFFAIESDQCGIGQQPKILIFGQCIQEKRHIGPRQNTKSS